MCVRVRECVCVCVIAAFFFNKLNSFFEMFGGSGTLNKVIKAYNIEVRPLVGAVATAPRGAGGLFSASVYIHIYIQMCLCVCACVIHTHTHIHKHAHTFRSTVFGSVLARHLPRSLRRRGGLAGGGDVKVKEIGELEKMEGGGRRGCRAWAAGKNGGRGQQEWLPWPQMSVASFLLLLHHHFLLDHHHHLLLLLRCHRSVAGARSGVVTMTGDNMVTVGAGGDHPGGAAGG